MGRVMLWFLASLYLCLSAHMIGEAARVESGAFMRNGAKSTKIGKSNEHITGFKGQLTSGAYGGGGPGYGGYGPGGGIVIGGGGGLGWNGGNGGGPGYGSGGIGGGVIIGGGCGGSCGGGGGYGHGGASMKESGKN